MVMRKMMMMMIRKMRQASVTGQGGDGGTTPLAHLEGNHRSLHIISIFFLTSNYFWSVFYHYNSLNLGDHLKSMSLQIFIEVFRSQTLLPFQESVYTKCCTHTRRKDKLTSTLGWAHWPHWAPWAVCQQTKSLSSKRVSITCGIIYSSYFSLRDAVNIIQRLVLALQNSNTHTKIWVVDVKAMTSHVLIYAS